jgi:hypothetical protein
MKKQLMFPAARRWRQQWAPDLLAHAHVDNMGDLTPKQKERWLGRFRCVDCRKCTFCSGEYYMVADALWSASGMGPFDGMLCLLCLEQRIGRELTINDFTAVVPRRWKHHQPDRVCC